jgi:sporulation protein YlmC with PRC-barrel domain
MSGSEMSDVQGLSGHKVIDNQGQKVGKVADVLFDEGTSQPQWALVEVGRLMRHQTAVPLQEAYRDDEGDLVVAYPADEVKQAPRLNAGTVLTHLEERHLREHYRLPGMN